MMKNWLSYFQNLKNRVLNSRIIIFGSGVLVGSLIDFTTTLSSIPTGFWVVSSFGLIGFCYFFYIKYKLNQDTFGDF